MNIQELPKTSRTTATYPEIKAYIKEKHGFEKRENYNKGKDGHRVPNCPPQKEKALTLWNVLNWPRIAFKRFGGVIPHWVKRHYTYGTKCNST